MASKVKQLVNIEWKIMENELQQLRNSIDGYLQSNVYYIPDSGIQYSIKIFPNGHDDHERPRQARIYLWLKIKEKKEIESEFSILVATANVAKQTKYIYEESHGWGCPVCTTNELFDPAKRFFVDGEMVVKVDGFLMIDKNASPELCKLGTNGNQIFINLWNQESKDFTIVADGKEIHAHKIILTAHSPVFAAMFQPHTKEAQENRVTIPDFTFNVVEAAIKYCYDSSLVGNVTLDDQMSLLQFFDKYDMNLLKDDLEKHLVTQIRDSTACRLANCSFLSNAPELQRKCEDHLQQCFRENINNKVFIRDHDLREQGPADDYISLIYVITEMINGKLPWRSVYDRKLIVEMKREYPTTQDFKRLPKEIRQLYREMILKKMATYLFSDSKQQLELTKIADYVKIVLFKKVFAFVVDEKWQTWRILVKNLFKNYRINLSITILYIQFVKKEDV